MPGKRLPPDRVLAYFAAVGRLESHGVLSLDIDPRLMLVVVAELQLALRHPENTGPTRRKIERLTRDWQAWLVELEPDLAEVLELGWNPEYDQEPAARTSEDSSNRGDTGNP